MDWGAQVGKHIHLGGPNPAGTVLAPVADILEGDSDKETLLVGLDVVTLGDLVQDKSTENGHVREWLPKDTLDAAGLNGIHSVLRRCPLPTGDIAIRVGSCLCLDDSVDVLEFLGWVNELVCVRRWSPVIHKKKAERGDFSAWFGNCNSNRQNETIETKKKEV